MGTLLAWEGGGDGEVVAFASDVVEVLASRPFPPGSRPRSHSVATGALVWVKVHGSRLEPSGRYRVVGRLIDVTRAVREEFAASLAAPPAQAP